MKLPDLLSTWLKDGWLSPDAPTAKVIQESADAGRHTRLRGFKFAGPGWYPKHRVFITHIGEKHGEPTYELRFFLVDPRPFFLALAQHPTVE